MESIKISVIVPSFNQGDYIENCIRSVLKQSYSNWELIIQDAISTDNTAEICRNYASKDSRIKFYAEKDRGFADAVNRGLQKTSGILAAIQSSDDFFSYNGVFRDVVNIYEADDKLILIAGASVTVDENLNLLETNERVTKYVPIENIFVLKDHFSQGATFFSIKRALSVGKLNPNVDMVADTDFWIRLTCYNPIILNSIYQTSKIWCCVTVQPNQRSADLSKFYVGRAKMAVEHVNDYNLSFSQLYKKNHANSLITIGIEHFKSIKRDPQVFYELFTKLNKINYISVVRRRDFKRLFRIFFPNKIKYKVYNSKKDLYSKNLQSTPSINLKWFN